jgi:predicted nucleic acid-binding protein
MAISPVLLDTDVVIRHFRRIQAVSQQLEAAEALYLPAIVLGELYHGAFHGPQREKELRSISELLPAVTVLGITAKKERPSWCPRVAFPSRKRVSIARFHILL